MKYDLFKISMMLFIVVNMGALWEATGEGFSSGFRKSAEVSSVDQRAMIESFLSPAANTASSVDTQVKEFFLNPSEAQIRPHLIVDASFFDFGVADPGVVLTHTFILRNMGNAPLLIEKVQPACGCTAAKPTKELIEPGGIAYLVAKLDLHGRNGPQDRAIAVTTNDPGQRQVQLSLKGVVKSRISMEPTSLDLGRVLPNQERESQVVTVRLSEGLQLKPVEVITSHSDLIAEMLHTEIDSELQVRVSTASLPEGQFSGWVKIRTDQEGAYKEIPIDVRGYAGNGGPILRGDELDITGPVLDGSSVSLKELQGHPTVVVFWASWCGHCRKEVPHLVELNEKYGPQGLKIIGVNMDKERAAALEFCDRSRVTWPNIHFSQESNEEGTKTSNPIFDRYQLRGIPAVYLVGADGRVKATGVRGAALEKQVEHLMAEVNP